MESVCSCSPGASTSSASAAGACFPHRPSASTVHPAVVAKNTNSTIVTELSLKPNLMPHSRDERRYDTFFFPAGSGRTRWSQVVSGGVPTFSTFHCYREPRQQMSSYYPQNSRGPAPIWNRTDAPPDHWHTYEDRPVVPLETIIPNRFSSGIIRPIAQFDEPARHRSPFLSHTRTYGNNYEQRRRYTRNEHYPAECNEKETSKLRDTSRYRSIVAIPENVMIPKEISPGDPNADSSAETSLGKRSTEVINQSESSPMPKRSRGKQGCFDKLDLLCSATLELGPLQENPSGCSCPKSKCIALYCDCFKAGRRCNPDRCSCLNCKNTVEESGPNGARSKVRPLV
jgi:Tesmin/TSO1-like CXC domain, cysteine-rich domain